MRESGQEPRMPDIENGEYLFDALCVLGPMRASGMGGFRAADWPEILAFAQATGRISDQVEFELLYEMAQEFVQGLLIGNNLFGIEPMEQAESGGD